MKRITLILLALAVVSCAAPAPTPDPAIAVAQIAQAVSQTLAALPTQTPYPTNTPYPTLTPVPSNTPIPATNTPASTNTPTKAPTASVGTRSNPVPKGQAITLEKGGFTYNIKITKTMRGAEAWAKLQADNMFNGQLKDMEYLLAHVVCDVTAGPKDVKIGLTSYDFGTVSNNKLYAEASGVVSPEFGVWFCATDGRGVGGSGRLSGRYDGAHSVQAGHTWRADVLLSAIAPSRSAIRDAIARRPSCVRSSLRSD